MGTNGVAIRSQEKRTGGGRVVKWSHEDRMRRYLTDSPTPAGFATLMKNVDDGDVAAMVEMDEEMRSKDLHLQGETAKRMQSLTALPWSIEAADFKEDQPLADEVAAYVRETLEAIATFDDTLIHLATAVGPNIATTELIWEKSALVATQDIGGHRLQSIPSFGPEIYLITDENPWPGEDMPLGKFIVHTPNAQAGFPFRVTMTRALAWLYVLKHFSVADWSAFSERFGTPFIYAMMKDEAPDGAFEQTQDLLKDMGADTWALRVTVRTRR